MNHVWTLADASSLAGAAFHLFRREGQAAHEHIEAVMRVSPEAGLAIWQTEGTCYCGWQQILVGQVNQGIAQLRQGLDVMQSIGTVRHRTSFLAALAEGYAKETFGLPCNLMLVKNKVLCYTDASTEAEKMSNGNSYP